MNIIYTIFVYFVWFLSTYFIITFLLHVYKYKDELFKSPMLKKGDTLPKISIVISAFNEEKQIKKTILSLQKIDYPKDLLEIIILNDGSKDRTAKIALPYADGKHLIFIDNLVNKGKAACLNQGISLATGEFIACMDADSQVMPNILMKTVPYFKKRNVGAVTVTVEVEEKKTLLQKIVDLEFILGLSLFLKIFSFFDCIFVTPGPFSVFRKSMLDEIGGFDETNITEDLEIAYRIHKAGYRIENCMDTKVITYIPPTFKALHTQRKRWYSGAILTLWQHRNIFNDKNVGFFKFFIPFNYGLIFFGLGLFLYSTSLGIKNFIKYLSYYSLTNFNFLSNWSFNFDFLSISIFSFFGLSAIILTILFVTFGLVTTKKSIKKRSVGFIGYIFLFFLYQFFWLSSIILVLRRRRAKWR